MFDCLSHIFKYTFCPRGAVSFYRLSALISMAMTLPMLNTTHNSNPVCNTDLALHCDNILLSHWIICILRGSSRNVGSWNVQIYSMLIILRWSQNSKRGRPAVHCHFPLDLHFATTQPCFCKDFKHVFYKPHYVV